MDSLKKKFDMRDSMRPDPQTLAATYRLSLAPKKRTFALVKRPRKKPTHVAASKTSADNTLEDEPTVNLTTGNDVSGSGNGVDGAGDLTKVNTNKNDTATATTGAVYIGTSCWKIDEGAEDDFMSNDEDYEDDLRPESSHNATEDQAQVTYNVMCKALDVKPFKIFHNALVQDTVNLSYMALSPDDVKACATALVHTNNVDKVIFDGNNMGPLGTARVAEILPHKFEFRELVIRNNNIGSEGARILCNVLLNNNSIRKLDLSGNDFQEEDGATFGELLEENHALRELNLSHNNFRCRGGQLIADGLAKNRFLQKLDLSWNHLRMEGAKALGDALQENSDLEELNVAWNGFHLRGCMSLGHALQHNNSLLSLDLTCNRISELCLSQLLKGLKDNTSLTTLKLPKNPLSPQSAYSILQFIDKHGEIALNHIDLGDQCVYDEFKTFLEELQKARDLTVIYGPLLRTGMVLHSGEVEKEEEEPDVLEENPLIVLMEFCRLQNLRLVDMFNTIDTDNSRSLTYTEFVDGLQKVNIPLSEESLKSLLKMLDLDNDGNIDFSELVNGQKMYKELVKDALREGPMDSNVIGQIGLRMKQQIKERYLLRKF